MLSVAAQLARLDRWIVPVVIAAPLVTIAQAEVPVNDRITSRPRTTDAHESRTTDTIINTSASRTTDSTSLLGPIDEPLVPAGVPGPLRSTVQSQMLGTGAAVRYTWHLSVINGGQPRGDRFSSDAPKPPAAEKPRWPERKLHEALWTFRGTAGRNQTMEFGEAKALPVRGDFNGDGQTEMGAFLHGQWFIDINGNGRWDENDLYIRFGQPGDIPLVGDWDGDGKADIGVFGRAWMNDEAALAQEPGLPDAGNQRVSAGKNLLPLAQRGSGWRTVQLTSAGASRVDRTSHVLQFGTAGDIPVVGDWNGDGVDNIGIFRRGRWVLDFDGDGRFSEADTSFDLGADSDIPVVGDFNGDGTIDLGVYRRGQWLIDLDGDHAIGDGDLRLEFGNQYDRPMPGDFTGTGADQIGIYRATSPADRRL